MLALVGGYDAAESPFDRVTQARRQPGSAFKPFVYAAALAAGFSQASMLPDYPQQYWDPVVGAFWKPRNYNDRFRGLVTLREAFVRSLNNPTIELMRKVGTKRVLKVARAAGIQSPLDANLGIALGTSEVSLLELTRAYGVFANGGHRVEPRFVRRVLDHEGRVLAENLDLLPADPDAAASPGTDPAIDPRVAFVVADLMRGAVDEPDGTGGFSARWDTTAYREVTSSTSTRSMNRILSRKATSPSAVPGSTCAQTASPSSTSVRWCSTRPCGSSRRVWVGSPGRRTSKIIAGGAAAPTRCGLVAKSASPHRGL